MTNDLEIYEVVGRMSPEAIASVMERAADCKFFLVAMVSKEDEDTSMSFEAYTSYEDNFETLTQCVAAYVAVAVEAHRRMVVCSEAAHLLAEERQT